MDNLFVIACLLVLLPLGVGLLWLVRWLFRAQGSVDNPLRMLMTIAGWTLILIGVFGALTILLVVASPLGWLIVLAILAMAVARYRTLERRSLIWTLSISAAKGIPLEEAARAFAQERVDGLGARAARLASLLESGMSLADAVVAARMWLPTDALVAVRVGCETGRLAPALSRVSRADDELDYLVRSVFEKFVYLGLVVNFLLFMLTFLMIKIVPVFAKMFEEFGLELPKLTQMVVFVADTFARYGILFLPLILFFLAILFLGVLYYVGWLPRDLPVLSRLAIRADSAVVLRTLALAVKQNIALDQMVWTLARLYPKRSIRSRLLAAGQQINNGRNWCDSLHAVGLTSAADVAVLKSAQRVGNLDWALDEMADSSLRRLTYRLRLWLNVLFPIVLLVFGVIIAFHVVGLFMPLVSLIVGLT